MDRDRRWVEGKWYDAITAPSFSPDSRRVAHFAKSGSRYLAVLDGVEGKLYDGVLRPVFSPDGKHLAYWAKDGNPWTVVVDGVAGKQYQGMAPGSTIVFDAPDRLRYLAVRGNSISLVEERLR